jgi:Flp pilus assembly protein TadB
VILAAVVCSGIAVAAAASLMVKPRVRLAPRVRPYSVASIVSLGGVPELGPVKGRSFGSAIGRFAGWLSHVVGESGESEMRLRLRQADLFSDVAEEHRLEVYRLRQLSSTIVWIGLGFVVAIAFGMRAGGALAVAGLSGLVGVTRWRGRLERAIDDRRTRLRIEVYTVNQLLAMRVRVGGGVVQAVRYVVDRGVGAMASELAEVLRLHRSGVPASEALAAAARSTPESHVARTYWLLSSAEERGADLAGALLALSEDVREARREAIRRTATKRRAAMLIPTIAILAPIMLLFVAAPLPRIVFGGL